MTESHNTTPAFARREEERQECLLDKLRWEEFKRQVDTARVVCRSQEHMELVRDQLIDHHIPMRKYDTDRLIIDVSLKALEDLFPGILAAQAAR